jgi:hypothetical protein
MSGFARKVARKSINRKLERKMLKQILANNAEMEQMETIMKMYEKETGKECTTYAQATDYFMKDKEVDVDLTEIEDDDSDLVKD